MQRGGLVWGPHVFARSTKVTNSKGPLRALRPPPTQHAELSFRRHAEISDVSLDGLFGPTQRAFT